MKAFLVHFSPKIQSSLYMKIRRLQHKGTFTAQEEEMIDLVYSQDYKAGTFTSSSKMQREI